MSPVVNDATGEEVNHLFICLFVERHHHIKEDVLGLERAEGLFKVLDVLI